MKNIPVRHVIKMKRIILAPHPDDEIIGCGNLLTFENNDDTYVIHIIDRLQPGNNRTEISRKNAEELGYKTVYLGHKVESINQKKLEAQLREILPEIYIPVIYRHKDHKIVNKIAKKVIKDKIKEYYVYSTNNRFIGRGKSSKVDNSKKTKYIKRYKETPRPNDRFRPLFHFFDFLPEFDYGFLNQFIWKILKKSRSKKK